MSNSSPLESIFFTALGMQSSAERAAFLDEACDGHGELRRRVDSMLAVQADAGSFLEHPASPPDATSDHPLREGPGTQIGPCKLLEQIGEGGMGVVFMAEQTRPVQRRVAPKIIKAGMDTRQVVARFEAERQALAMMDHPNIARVLDAGATESGRPYFVMELVRGVPMTEFCNEKNLTIRGRLELFVTVCQAVQHWTDATSGGLWSNSGNWSSSVVANGTDGIADFSTLNITDPTTLSTLRPLLNQRSRQSSLMHSDQHRAPS